jgi:hypothetical protein
MPAVARKRTNSKIVSVCPLSAKTGLMHRNKRRPRGCNDLLNHLVGGGLQRKRHGKAERLCGQAGAIRPPEIKLYRLSEAADSRV